MKSLQESLLDDTDILMDRADEYNQVKQWLDKNAHAFNIINPKINNDNTIDCDSVRILNNVGFVEFPIYIKFNKVKHFFIEGVQQLESTRGFPIICDKLFIKGSYRLKKIDLPTKQINDTLIIVDCPVLENIWTEIKSVSLLRLWDLPKLENLEHITKTVNNIELHSLSKIKSLKGLPDKIGTLELSHCRKLSSLDGCPKHIKDVYGLWGLDMRFIQRLKEINNIKN